MIDILRVRWKAWRNWRKRYDGRAGYKILVLFGFRHSPTFEMDYAFYKCCKIRREENENVQ